jgi:hypothetical protein
LRQPPRAQQSNKKDVYPLPRIDDTVDALNGAKYLTAFDMLSGYWQVQVAPED